MLKKRKNEKKYSLRTHTYKMLKILFSRTDILKMQIHYIPIGLTLVRRNLRSRLANSIKSKVPILKITSEFYIAKNTFISTSFKTLIV